MKVHYSSKSNEWATPQSFFDRLNAEFKFTLDPCSTDKNSKCAKHFTKLQNGLSQDWRGERVFMNPPYGRGKSGVGAWMRKAQTESAKINGPLVVALVPARTDTKWFHDYVAFYGYEIRFVKGRLKFGGGKNSAPFPSMLVIFDSNTPNYLKYSGVSL